MNKQPEFYSLKFYSNADFWAQAGGAARRTFIMPLSNPKEFLAFGVLSPSEQVLFVARGQVVEHLGGFIARMVQAQASVEFYARAPLPGRILSPYIVNEDHEQKEIEPPPPPPPLQSGEVATVAGGAQSLQDANASLWPADNGRRSIIAVPVPNSAEYLAIGLIETDDAQSHYRAPFVARVTDLGGFTQRIQDDNAPVEVSTTTPDCLKSYVGNFISGLQNSGSMAPAI